MKADNKEAMKLALEALESGKPMFDAYWGGNQHDKAITALREALAEQPAQQDSTCSNALRIQHKAYPRTCKKCGLGPCVELAQQALDKMAENARELGLDYEPVQQEPVLWLVNGVIQASDIPKDYSGCLFTSSPASKPLSNLTEDNIPAIPPASKPWVGLTLEDIAEVAKQEQLLLVCDGMEELTEIARVYEAKLRELNT